MTPSANKSKQPYLLRALYDWMVDNDLTPYLLVAANSTSVVVPREFVEDGKIVLNISSMAVRNLVIGNELIAFDGRFSGKPFTVSTPVANVLTIYAKETGEGMMFDSFDKKNSDNEEVDTPGENDPLLSGSSSKRDGPARPGDHLKVVK